MSDDDFCHATMPHDSDMSGKPDLASAALQLKHQRLIPDCTQHPARRQDCATRVYSFCVLVHTGCQHLTVASVGANMQLLPAVVLAQLQRSSDTHG